MRQQKYFNNKKMMTPRLANRRDADKLITACAQTDLILSLWALRDEFDFGEKRLNRFLDKRRQLLDSYNKGYVSVDDLKTTLKKETGIDVELW